MGFDLLADLIGHLIGNQKYPYFFELTTVVVEFFFRPKRVNIMTSVIKKLSNLQLMAYITFFKSCTIFHIPHVNVLYAISFHFINIYPISHN